MAEHHYFGRRSLASLETTHPQLRSVVEGALKLSDGDFMVGEGGRTPARQRQLVARGVSWTMNSRHMIDADGTSYAVDLWPYINGKIYWSPPSTGPYSTEWAPYHHIYEAMLQSACSVGLEGLEWGVKLWGKDAPHYQLNWDLFPPAKD